MTNVANDAIVMTTATRGTSNMSHEVLEAELERLKAENEQLENQRARASPSRPARKEAYRAFIKDNDEKLKTKSEA
ncbi:MAG: hypothetical protein M3541_22725 [Acidobacteriota bacterium]|nr:hypothetical protein [Acidobacteriota bacterium]